jgi:hypothetical protein
MVISPLVLLLMVIRVGSNLVLCLGTQRDVLPTAPVNSCSLTRTQLPVGINEEALQAKG